MLRADSLRRCKEDRGFTLLELIISITMVALMVTIIIGAMRLGYRSIEKGERKMEDLQRIRASLSVIESQIESEIPISYDDPDKGRIFHFSGSREAVRFPTTFSLWTNERGYVLASYKVVTDGHRRKALQLTENMISVETYREAMLLKGYDAIHFEYFYREPAEENGRWVEEWTDTTVIPEKIRMHLVSGTQHFVMTIPMRTPPSTGTALAASTDTQSAAVTPRSLSPRTERPTRDVLPRTSPAERRMR